MQLLPTILFLATLLSSATAAVTGVTAVDCNGFEFTLSETQSACNAALSHLVDGTTVGADHYPHQYQDFEGFTFDAGCNPPYYEFPIFQTHVYTGGSPGADRIVIGSVSGNSAVFCDGITHFGASGNDFLQCDNA